MCRPTLKLQTTNNKSANIIGPKYNTGYNLYGYNHSGMTEPKVV